MRVHLIRRKTVEDFVRHNAQARVPFADWLAKIKYADWETPEDIQATFRSADLLGRGSNRAVFDIGGNKYRVIGKYAFGETKAHLFICNNIPRVPIKRYVMATILKYRVIKNKHQYLEYTQTLEQLVALKAKDQNAKDEVDLLTVLIEKWDAAHNSFRNADPVRLLLSLMKDHDLKAKDLVEILGISKSYISDILHYKKGLSKDVIRKLAQHFKVSQEAFNRPYKLKGSSKTITRSDKSATRKKAVV